MDEIEFCVEKKLTSNCCSECSIVAEYSRYGQGRSLVITLSLTLTSVTLTAYPSVLFHFLLLLLLFNWNYSLFSHLCISNAALCLQSPLDITSDYFFI